MMYRHKTTGKEIRVLAFIKRSVQYDNGDNSHKIDTMTKHVLDTEYERIEDNS